MPDAGSNGLRLDAAVLVRWNGRSTIHPSISKPLLRTETRPWLRLLPRSVGPLVLTCEHATHRLPSGLRPSAAERKLLATHWGWDPGAWWLTREMSRELRASALGGRWSRLWIDLNRRIDDSTLARREVEGLPLSWNRHLGVTELESRIVAHHAPYHEELDRLLLRRVLRGLRPLLLAVHTFTPLWSGRQRRFDVGVLYERHGDLARCVARGLRHAGLIVRYNQPYSGMKGMMYSADRHGSHHGLPCLELEVNQRLFARRTDATRVSAVLIEATAELIQRRDFRSNREVTATAAMTMKKHRKKPTRNP